VKSAIINLQETKGAGKREQGIKKAVGLGERIFASVQGELDKGKGGGGKDCRPLFILG